MIKAQGDREQAMSEAEWKQLSNLIENDRRERVRLTCLSMLLVRVRPMSVSIAYTVPEQAVHQAAGNSTA